jgi:hypothetical protein
MTNSGSMDSVCPEIASYPGDARVTFDNRYDGVPINSHRSEDEPKSVALVERIRFCYILFIIFYLPVKTISTNLDIPCS